MQVCVHEQLLSVVVEFEDLGDGKDLGLLVDVWVVVVPIEILIENIHPVVSVINPIRIYHRDEFKHEVFSQDFSTDIFPNQE